MWWLELKQSSGSLSSSSPVQRRMKPSGRILYHGVPNQLTYCLHLCGKRMPFFFFGCNHFRKQASPGKGKHCIPHDSAIPLKYRRDGRMCLDTIGLHTPALLASPKRLDAVLVTITRASQGNGGCVYTIKWTTQQRKEWTMMAWAKLQKMEGTPQKKMCQSVEHWKPGNSRQRVV